MTVIKAMVLRRVKIEENLAGCTIHQYLLILTSASDPQSFKEEQGVREARDPTHEIGQHAAVVNDCYQGNRDVKEAHPEVCNGQVAYDRIRHRSKAPRSANQVTH